jgi:DUF4097 and DUF4098 domain-containing protein YvlB
MASMPPPPGRPPGPPSGPPPGQPYGQGFPNQPYANQPYPNQPYQGDPRDYWRYEKAQRKAAWRAQRDAWRVQRDVLRAQNRVYRVPSIGGPIVLISMGVIFLLVMYGKINAGEFWTWFGHWWPLLLIGLGLIAFAEWAIDLRSDKPRIRRSGGYVWLVVLLVVLGASASGWQHFWGPLRADFGDDNDNFFNSLGEPQHDLDQAVLNTQIPAGANIEIQNPRGDVSIAAGDGTEMAVTAHQVAYAATDSDAKKIFDSQKAHVTVTGNAVLVKVDGNSSGRTNLTITVPRLASLNVNTNHGNVTVAGISGNVDAQMEHGNLEATSIDGHIHVHVDNEGDVSAHNIKGDVTVEGNGGDLTISDIHGKVTMQGDYTGNSHVQQIDQAVHFHTSRTDLEFARLPGDMSINGDALHATQVVGPVRVICSRSKDIEMSQVYGETRIEDKDARVELEMAGSYPVDVRNNKGDIEIALPPGAGVDIDGKTHNGDIVSDFPLVISGDENKTISGNVGKGGPRITLSTENADLHLRKGAEAPPLSAAAPTDPPAAPHKPAAPGSPNVPHLKAPKGQTEQPVSQ